MSTTLPLHRPAPVLSLALAAARRACLVVARACGHAARALQARARRAEDRALMLAMTARELNDLGVGRCDVERLMTARDETRGQV